MNLYIWHLPEEKLNVIALAVSIGEARKQVAAHVIDHLVPSQSKELLFKVLTTEPTNFLHEPGIILYTFEQ